MQNLSFWQTSDSDFDEQDELLDEEQDELLNEQKVQEELDEEQDELLDEEHFFSFFLYFL